VTDAIKAGEPGKIYATINLWVGGGKITHPFTRAGGVRQSMVDFGGRSFDILIKSKGIGHFFS
jgi:hypothetical protein